MVSAGTATLHAPMGVAAAPRRITILGATGSIGTSTLQVIAARPGAFQVEAVTANSDVVKLARIARTSGARLAAIADPSAYGALKEALAGSDIEATAGAEAVVEAAGRPADLVVGAIVGAAGLAPTYAAIVAGTPVALANKECLVSGGGLFIKAAKTAGVPILPVDSEHNAIFQILSGRGGQTIERIVLTASGGPFREWSRDRMAHATPAEAVAHPTWPMGRKISVDSATLMNKGLELIEAHHLFAMPGARLDVIIHPQSIVHGMVEWADGTVLAALGATDMRGPIAHCLNWPDVQTEAGTRLDLAKMGTLSFSPPDLARFPALSLARAALDRGTRATNILNAANETAVRAFLAGQLGFLQIAGIVEQTLRPRRTSPPRRRHHHAHRGDWSRSRRATSGK